MAKVDEILRIAPFAAERISAWRNSTDGFIFFVMEETSGGRLGVMAAKDIGDLLGKIEELFDTHLLPPANPTFNIFVAPPDNKMIYDRVARWLLATVAAPKAGVKAATR